MEMRDMRFRRSVNNETFQQPIPYLSLPHALQPRVTLNLEIQSCTFTRLL